MATTWTKLKGPVIVPGKGAEITFSVALDSAFATGGEVFAAVTSYFSHVGGGVVEGCDAAADATWRYGVVCAGIATAATTSNVLLVAHHGAGSDTVDNPADAEDLHTVGALIVTLWGRPVV
jgi:hypothetical protein